MPGGFGGAAGAAGAQALLIDDERRKSEPMLRPSLLPSLLLCRKANQDVGNRGVRLFETAATWTRQAGQIAESRKLALLSDVGEGGLSDGQLVQGNGFFNHDHL